MEARRKKNIGIDATPLQEQLTGIGNYLYYLLEVLVQKRSEDHFFLYAIKETASLSAFRQCINVTLRIIPFLGISEALWSQTTLAWYCRKDKIDLFWGVTQSIPLFAAHRTVLTIHDFAYRLYPQTVPFVRGSYLRFLGKYLYKKADRLVAISKASAKRLQKLYGLTVHQVIIPPQKNIAPPSQKEVDEVLKKYSLTYKDYFLMVGTLEPRKNIVPILRAYRSKYPLVLVGKKGWRDALISHEIKKSCINYLGYLPDSQLRALIKGAKAYVMPSLYEGYGMPIAEARSLGTAVVCSAVPEMIEAAEGDARIIKQGQFEQAFKVPIIPPQKTTYPSNETLVNLLSEEISTLL